MSDKPQKPSREDDKDKQKKPRGMGGVFVIMLMLMVLFVIVARAGLEGGSSIDALYSHLLNGRVERLLITGDVATAEIRGEKGRPQTVEVVVRDLLRSDLQLFHQLATLKLDTVEYPATDKDALGAFLADIESGKARVLQAYFVHEAAAKAQTDRPAQAPQTPPTRVAGDYLCALLRKDNRTVYVRLDPSETTSLQQAHARLDAQKAQIRDFQLTLGTQEFRISEPNTAMLYLLTTIGPWLLILGVVWFFFLRQMRAQGGSGGVLSFGRSRAALYTKENRTNVTFDDVAGMDEAKAEVREIIEFLKNPQKFARLGGSIPRGVLLVGSPGTGKTLLAKAIAGEAEVPFFSISGSDFVEMFVGVGASRVRDLFKQAREASPCIVFLDEIDAVGRKRGAGMGGGHDEREQTLNAILVEMDGFDSDKGIILVGATNRPDVLDAALLRPGRFDRQVVIDPPDVKGREAILKVHARKVRMAANVDLVRIAKATPGFSGAELAAVINEAAILAAMKNEDAVEMNDLEEARDRVRWGREKKSRAIEEKDRKVTAYHEAGHAIVSVMTPDQDPVHKVTIVSRGRALGATMSLPEKDDYNHWRKKLLGRIAVCFGGRIAEEIVFGDVSAGAQNDIEQATNLAKVMVCELGMSPAVGPIKYTTDDQNPFLGREFHMASDLSQKTLELVNDEVRRIIAEQYEAARKLLAEHRGPLDRLAEALLKHETLNGDEVGAVVRGDTVEEYRAAQQRMAAATAEPARRAAADSPSVPAAAPQAPKPDVGLSGA